MKETLYTIFVGTSAVLTGVLIALVFATLVDIVAVLAGTSAAVLPSWCGGAFVGCIAIGAGMAMLWMIGDILRDMLRD